MDLMPLPLPALPRADGAWHRRGCLRGSISAWIWEVGPWPLSCDDWRLSRVLHSSPLPAVSAAECLHVLVRGVVGLSLIPLQAEPWVRVHAGTTHSQGLSAVDGRFPCSNTWWWARVGEWASLGVCRSGAITIV